MKDINTSIVQSGYKPSFYISNLGPLGAKWFDATLPPGVSGILAIGAEFQSGDQLNAMLTLTTDHRTINGALSAQFLQVTIVYLNH